MSAAIRTLLIFLIAAPVIVILGYEVGDDEFLIPGIVGITILAIATKVFCFPAVRADGFVLGILIFGYLVGNRGFAQLGPSSNSPIFVGEIGMVVCLGIFTLQAAFKRIRVFPDHPLSWPIFAYLVYAGLRLAFVDFHEYQLNAVRDSAMVYYALFFFITYHICKEVESRRFLEGCIIWALVFLIPTSILTVEYPEVYDVLSIRGVPLIYQKGDLLGIFLAVGMLYFFLVSEVSRWPKTFLRLSLVCFGLVLALGSRSGYVAMFTAMVFLFVAKRYKLFYYQAGLIGAGALIFLIIQAAMPEKDFSNSRGYAIYETAVSIFDTSGSRQYVSLEEKAPGDNNQWRLMWWQTVYDETVEKAPWFGLGLGYDLTTRFLDTKYGPMYAGDNVAVRSPHSYIFSVFGRLGVVGMAIFSAIVFLIMRSAYRQSRVVVRDRDQVMCFAHWVGAITILTGAAFGVVLEGPMGGILFWSFIGLAVSYNRPALAAVSLSPLRPRLMSLREHFENRDLAGSNARQIANVR